MAQVIVFLGFEIKIKNLCIDVLSNFTLTLNQAASILGNIAESFEAVPYGHVHYLYLEQNKISTLRKTRQNFESLCTLTSEALMLPCTLHLKLV